MAAFPAAYLVVGLSASRSDRSSRPSALVPATAPGESNRQGSGFSSALPGNAPVEDLLLSLKQRSACPHIFPDARSHVRRVHFGCHFEANGSERNKSWSALSRSRSRHGAESAPRPSQIPSSARTRNALLVFPAPTVMRSSGNDPLLIFLGSFHRKSLSSSSCWPAARAPAGSGRK